MATSRFAGRGWNLDTGQGEESGLFKTLLGVDQVGSFWAEFHKCHTSKQIS